MRATFGIFLLVTLLFAPRTGRAAGFLIFEGGAKALGMGGAFTARADDPSAIFFNPAGLSQVDGVQAYGGFTLIFTGTDFSGVDPDPGFGTTGETGTLLFSPINAYLSWQFDPKVTVGIGLFNMFGLGQDWKNPSTFIGRHIATKIDLRTFFVNPTVAWQPIDDVSFGFGLDLVYATVDLRRYVQQWDPNGQSFLDIGTTRLEGDNGLDVGWNVGGLYHSPHDVNIGVSFRSQITADVEGPAGFVQVPSGDPALDQAVAAVFPSNQSVKTTIKLPYIMSLGVAYTGVERWEFEVDFNYVAWSRFNALVFEFSEDASLNTIRPQNYDDKWSLRTGFGYDVWEELTLRAGYYFDPTPQPQLAMSPLLGDITRHGLTGGVGYHAGAVTFDGFMLILFSTDRSTDGLSDDGYNGTYSSFGNLFGLNVGYKW
ncbi:MAG: outer membrane protein transport protein [bacterium]|nr:outer membrane protein transport protein [bacterium]